MIDVFVSRPNWVPGPFEPGLKAFLERLDVFGMRPRTLGAGDNPVSAPLDDVIRLIDGCHGAIVMGFPQIEIRSGLVKGQPVPAIVPLPSEWNHIEAALAYARGLPLLIVSHVGVSRGIFDPQTTNGAVHEQDLTNPSWPLASGVSDAFYAWGDRVLRRAAVSAAAALQS